jgi:ubiquinone/menaquinone biosynthesis C-methylase UbiE
MRRDRRDQDGDVKMLDTRNKPASPDFAAIKTKQQAAWSAGDYSVVGVTLQIVGETLCEAMDLRAGQRVLDVAAGNGNCSLAAARRFCDVTSTDYVQDLLRRGRERAEAERLLMDFQLADAEALPFADGSFDAVVSTFGAMFAPDQEKVARELLRVCRPGGKIGMANWTPDSFIGGLFKTLGRYIPPAAGLKSPALWGTRERLGELFVDAAAIEINERFYVLRYRSAEHWIGVWRSIYGPLQKAFASLDDEHQRPLHADLVALVESLNVARDGAMVVPSKYLEVVITK